MNFVELCYEVDEWSTRNFGLDSPENKALGFVEEIGELAHAFLKMRQGIRGSKEEHQAAMADAVGDAMVYLADFCFKAGSVESFIGRHWLNSHFLDWYNYLFEKGKDEKFNSVHLLLSSLVQMEYLNRNIGELFSPGIYVEIIIENLIDFSIANNINFGFEVEKTWAQVKLRDWEKNKLTGEV